MICFIKLRLWDYKVQRKKFDSEGKLFPFDYTVSMIGECKLHNIITVIFLCYLHHFVGCH